MCSTSSATGNREKGPNQLSLYEDVIFPETWQIYLTICHQNSGREIRTWPWKKWNEIRSQMWVSDSASGVYQELTVEMNPAQQKAWSRLIHFGRFEKATLVVRIGQVEISSVMRDYLAVIRAGWEWWERCLIISRNGFGRNNPMVYTQIRIFNLGEHGWFDSDFMYKRLSYFTVWLFWQESFPLAALQMIGIQSWFDSDFLEITKLRPDHAGLSLLRYERGNNQPLAKKFYYVYFDIGSEFQSKNTKGRFDGRFKIISFSTIRNEWNSYEFQSDLRDE